MMEWFRKNVKYGPAFQAARIEEKALPLSPCCASLEGRKLLFLSDVHLCRRFPVQAVEKLLLQVEELKPDMLLLGGDYAESAAWQQTFFDMIGQLRVPMGKFAVAGNNDCECFEENFESLKEMAGQAGVLLLVDHTIRIDTGSGIISLAGLDEYRQAKPLKEPLFTEKDANAYRILMAHYPQSIAKYRNSGSGLEPHLALAGHTHGGQFKLLGLTPFSIGFEYRFLGTPLPAVSGWKEMGETKLLVSCGLGTSRIPLRIGVEPEIHLMRLGNAWC